MLFYPGYCNNFRCLLMKAIQKVYDPNLPSDQPSDGGK